MWLKVAALLLYLLLLFAVSRLLELSAVLGGWASLVNLESASSLAFFSTALVHPVSLSVREIKRILDARGVSYVDVIEKRELTDLVENSGRLMESELNEVISETENDDVQQESPNAITTSTTQFTCGSHFYEEVEDSKDSIWLVQVVPSSDEQYTPGSPPLDLREWQQLVARVKPFGIRTGVLDCGLDKRLCKKKGWHGHQIVLALPKGFHPKDSVVFHSYKGRHPNAASVFSWVRKRLSSRLTVVNTDTELQRFWINFTQSNMETKVRVLLATSSSDKHCDVDPPIVYSALSMKFTGRVSFGLIDRKLLDKSLPMSLNVSPSTSISYVVITPEGISVYGDGPGEHLNYKSMELYFRTLQPEMNDVFTLSLVLTNLLAFLDLFAIRRKLWRQLIHSAWTLTKYNVILFSFWIAVFGLNHLDFIRVISEFFLGMSRSVARSEHLGYLRHHYKFWRSSPRILITSFLMLWLVYGYVRRRWFQYNEDINTNNQPSNLSNFTNYLFSSRPRINVVHASDLEEGLTLWIERLATPNLWLYPLLPNDYVKDLPTWKFRGNSTKIKVTSDSIDSETSSELEETNDGAAVDGIHPHETLKGFLSTVGDGLLRWTIGKKRRTKSMRGRCTRPVAPSDTKEATSCAICLDDYVSGTILCGLPCGHNYHQKCIVGWLSRDHHNCPICRRSSYGNSHASQIVELR